MNVIDYIESRYAKTLFRFIPLVEIINKFGEQGRGELNELRKQGLIRRREGGNGTVIEYLPNKIES